MRHAKPANLPQWSSFNPELRVVGYIATRRDDAERGPQVRLNPRDARLRMLTDGEIVWIQGPRGQHVAPVTVDPTVAEHGCVLRDIQGVDVSEAVRISKPDFDTPTPGRSLA
jgi:anaerobic selenocysteine-containing dehydrogenase